MTVGRLVRTGCQTMTPTMRTTAWILLLLLPAGCGLPAVSPPASTPAAAEAASMAAGAALSADARAALDALSKAPAEAFRGKDAAFRSCMLERFDRDSVPETVTDVHDPLARDTLRIYQQYWWHVLRSPSDRNNAETRFAERLAAMMAEAPPKDEDSMDALQEKLNARLRERGFHSLQGRTLPLYDLFLWRTQDERDFDVELPAGEVERVRVHLMNDFVSRGWSYYATCGRRSAGGWAKPEGLYAVRQSYDDLADEKFRVTFLGHEAQHYADLRRWPTMPPWLLEYRAKLVELALADETLKDILQRFRESQGDDATNQPHPFANRKVIADLQARLGNDARTADLARSTPLCSAVQRATCLSRTRACA